MRSRTARRSRLRRQARSEQGEVDRTRHEAEATLERRRASEAFETERFRLMGEAANASAEKRASDEQWRRTVSEAAATRQLVETQRDEAAARAARAEEALAAAHVECRTLGEALARLHLDEQARPPRFAPLQTIETLIPFPRHA